MPNAARTGSARQPKAQRHRSTPNIAVASQAKVESRRPSGPACIDTPARTRSASRERQTTPAATNERSHPRATNSVTSRNASKVTKTPVQRPVIPTAPSSLRTATSPRQTTASSSTLTTSKQLSRSTGSLTTISKSRPTLSPPPKRRMSSYSGAAATKLSTAVAAHHQPRSADSKPVVISGRGYRTQAAASATPSTHDSGGKNASIRCRLGLAPNLLLPNCYQPGKAKHGTPARSISTDASIPLLSPAVADAPVTSPRIRRSVSVQEPNTSPPLPTKTKFEGYPEPPPEDTELNCRMEMLFEEYRKVERGLIFSDKQSSSSHDIMANSCCPTPSRPRTTTLSKPSVSGVAETVIARKRVGQTRAKSVGNLDMALSASYASARQQQSDRTVSATTLSSASGSSLLTSRAVTATRGGPSTTHQREQSAPGIARRPAPSPATPPPSRQNAVLDDVTRRPRQQTGKAADACPAGLNRAQSHGGAGMTRMRRDSLPTSLRDASQPFGDVSDPAALDNSFAGVDATKQPKRRASTPICSLTTGQRAVSRSSELMRVNSRNTGSRCNTVSEDSRQTAITASDSGSTMQSTSDDRRSHSTDEESIKLPDMERRSRSSAVGGRSFIPRPVSRSGRPPASRRQEDRNLTMTTKPKKFDQVLPRFDSGVDVATVGLSPSDDGVGSNEYEAVVQRLSASLEGTLALLGDNDDASPAWQNTPNPLDTVVSTDDEYY